ncbi:MAG: response regulator [Deltaproteobacteria bacterium]|nr:response regulator [Deltaproteobacteria bacterium]
MRTTTVLIVDDDQKLLTGLSRLLAQRMFLVFTAENADNALEMLETHEVDVVVSDECMPGLPGTRFLAHVAEMYPNIARILMTGNPTPVNCARAIGPGSVYRFLVKPFDPEYLVRVVEQAVRDFDAIQAPKAPGASRG